MKNGLKKGIAITTASLVGVTALVGVMHMPFARSFLMKVGGCPIVQATPEQLEQAQNAAATTRAASATEVAPMKPALGFVLEKTTADEVHAWIASKGLTCSDDVGGSIISCLNLPASAVGEQGPDIAQLQFAFHIKPQTLRLVSTFRQNMSRSDALAVMQARGAELTRELGAPNKVYGQPTLHAEPKSAAYAVTYNFKDYLANTQAAELGSGFTIAEHYISQGTAEQTN